MWPLLVLVAMAIVAIKLVNLALYWSRRGLVYEPFPRYLYRILWLFNTRVVNDVVCDDVRKYGKLYGSYRGGKPSLVVADADVAKDVLIKQFSNFFGRTFELRTGDPLWDNFLTHLPYDQWKSVRTVMGYAFTSSKLRGMIQKLDRVSKRLVEKLNPISRSDTREIELRDFLYGYSMDSMAAIAFGLDLNSIDSPDNDFVQKGRKLLKPTFSFILAMLCPSVVKYCPLVNFPPRDVSNFFGNLLKHVLKKKKKDLDMVMKNGTADIIDLHLLAQREDPKNHLTDEVLASQAFLFFVGGLDTLAIALNLCTYFLAINPDVQQLVYEEICSVLGDKTDVEYADVQKMKLLEASLLESLRMVPLSFSVDRIASSDTEVAGIPIKKGTVVEFPIAWMHQDPTYFPEPEKFIPQRFMKNGDVTSDTAAFLSFGDGPKGCIGRRLAIMNIQVLLANILPKFRLDRCPSTPVPLELAPGFRFSDIFQKTLVCALTLRL